MTDETNGSDRMSATESGAGEREANSCHCVHVAGPHPITKGDCHYGPGDCDCFPATPDADDASEVVRRPAWVTCTDQACPTMPEYPAHAHRAASTDASGALTDLRARAEAFLVQCGPCDGGLPMMCACNDGDPRPVIADLLDALARESAAATRARAEGAAAEREAWSSWLDVWTGAVGPEPPTVEDVARALRSGPRPFGCAKGSES